MIISYHDEPRIPLHAVKEDIEAEEAEEAAMSLQMSARVTTNGNNHHPIQSLTSSSSQQQINSVNHIADTPTLHPAVELCNGSSLNMNRGVDMNSFNKMISSNSEFNNHLSKSNDILDNEGYDNAYALAKLSESNFNTNNGSCRSQEFDLADGLPSLGDTSGSGGDDGMIHSPFQEGSPLSNSLASSVASNMSLDDTLSSRTDTSSFTDTQDTVVPNIQKPTKETLCKSSSSRLSHKPGSEKNSNMNKNSDLYSSGKSSECRRKHSGVMANRFIDGGPSRSGSAGSVKSSSSSSRNSPRASDRSSKADEKTKVMKIPVHDRRTCRSSTGLVSGSTVASRSKMADVENIRKSKHDSKCETKDRYSDSKYSTLERKKKERLKKEDDHETSTLGRRKKKIDDRVDLTVSWQDSTRGIETYGTLGRRRKIREAGDGKEDSSHSALSKENKDTLDTYATLPRRKAKEMTARWREQNLQNQTEFQPTIPHINLQASESISRPLRRSRSIGKGDSTRTVASYASGRSSGARPSPRIMHHGTATPSPRTAISTQTPRKERTIICLEAAIQTALLGHEVATAMRALARTRQLDGDLRPKVEIVRDYPMPESVRSKPSHCDAHVQVLYKDWWLSFY